MVMYSSHVYELREKFQILIVAVTQLDAQTPNLVKHYEKLTQKTYENAEKSKQITENQNFWVHFMYLKQVYPVICIKY